MNSSYIRSLDGLRCVAVTLVLVAHWIGDDKVGFYPSYLGVCMFFVLSGFLITGILIRAREADEKNKKGHGFSLRQFYIRRTLRIFPLYYLVVAILFIVNSPGVRTHWIWLVTYMTNNYMAYNQTWMGSFDHLWSLAVEEQFYLFFPLFAFFLPKKILEGVVWLFIPGAILGRAYFHSHGFEWITSYVFMPTCLDAFGLGALLAITRSRISKWATLFSHGGFLMSSVALWWGITQLSIGEVEDHNVYSTVYLRFSEALMSMSLIAYVSGMGRTVGQRTVRAILENSYFVYIGKVSYGIYVFHQFIYNPYNFTEDNWLFPVWRIVSSTLGDHTLSRFAFFYLLTLAVASLSWFAFEKPINQLKDRFGYRLAS